MGQRGPVGKRVDQRHGHRSEAENAVDRAPGSGQVKPPPASKDWHPVARRWYRSLAKSGQQHFYEESDWATAVLIAESISRDLSPQVVGVTDKGDVVRDTIPLKGASLNAYLKAFGLLLVTEGDRRRMRVELDKTGTEEAADVSWIDEARRSRGA